MLSLANVNILMFNTESCWSTVQSCCLAQFEAINKMDLVLSSVTNMFTN